MRVKNLIKLLMKGSCLTAAQSRYTRTRDTRSKGPTRGTADLSDPWFVYILFYSPLNRLRDLYHVTAYRFLLLLLFRYLDMSLAAHRHVCVVLAPAACGSRVYHRRASMYVVYQMTEPSDLVSSRGSSPFHSE